MGNDKTIPINVFRHSFRPILDLINEYDLRYQIRETRSGLAVASSGVIEVIVNASIWLSLASVVVAFIKAKIAVK